MRVRLPREADVPVISTAFLETDEILEQFEVHPGDQLFVLGFPYGAEANEVREFVLRTFTAGYQAVISTSNYTKD
jgi:hypothetical protein